MISGLIPEIYLAKVKVTSNSQSQEHVEGIKHKIKYEYNLQNVKFKY